jgi:hypothetical protein
MSVWWLLVAVALVLDPCTNPKLTLASTLAPTLASTLAPTLAPTLKHALTLGQWVSSRVPCNGLRGGRSCGVLILVGNTHNDYEYGLWEFHECSYL